MYGPTVFWPDAVIEVGAIFLVPYFWWLVWTCLGGWVKPPVPGRATAERQSYFRGFYW